MDIEGKMRILELGGLEPEWISKAEKLMKEVGDYFDPIEYLNQLKLILDDGTPFNPNTLGPYICEIDPNDINLRLRISDSERYFSQPCDGSTKLNFGPNGRIQTKVGPGLKLCLIGTALLCALGPALNNTAQALELAKKGNPAYQPWQSNLDTAYYSNLLKNGVVPIHPNLSYGIVASDKTDNLEKVAEGIIKYIRYSGGKVENPDAMEIILKDLKNFNEGNNSLGKKFEISDFKLDGSGLLIPCSTQLDKQYNLYTILAQKPKQETIRTVTPVKIYEPKKPDLIITAGAGYFGSLDEFGDPKLVCVGERTDGGYGKLGIHFGRKTGIGGSLNFFEGSGSYLESGKEIGHFYIFRLNGKLYVGTPNLDIMELTTPIIGGIGIETDLSRQESEYPSGSESYRHIHDRSDLNALGELGVSIGNKIKAGVIVDGSFGLRNSDKAVSNLGETHIDNWGDVYNFGGKVPVGFKTGKFSLVLQPQVEYKTRSLGGTNQGYGDLRLDIEALANYGIVGLEIGYEKERSLMRSNHSGSSYHAGLKIGGK